MQRHPKEVCQWLLPLRRLQQRRLRPRRLQRRRLWLRRLRPRRLSPRRLRPRRLLPPRLLPRRLRRRRLTPRRPRPRRLLPPRLLPRRLLPRRLRRRRPRPRRLLPSANARSNVQCERGWASCPPSFCISGYGICGQRWRRCASSTSSGWSTSKANASLVCTVTVSPQRCASSTCARKEPTP